MNDADLSPNAFCNYADAKYQLKKINQHFCHYFLENNKQYFASRIDEEFDSVLSISDPLRTASNETVPLLS